MRLAPVLLLGSVLAGGCDSGTGANVVGELGWDFDYRNWLTPRCGACADLGESDCGAADCTWDGAACHDRPSCTEAAPRGCDNQPPAADGPPFSAVATVHVVVLDPDRNQLTFDREIDCAEGGDGAAYPLRSLARKEQQVSLTALDAGGTVLYHGPNAFALDLTEAAEHRFTLRSPVGDVRVGVQYPGAGPAECPDDQVASLRATVTRLDSGDVVATATQSPACEGCLGGLCSRRVYVRGIPADPEPAGDAFIPRTFRLTVEARDAGGATLYCGTSERPIAPGANSDTSDVVLSAGPC